MRKEITIAAFTIVMSCFTLFQSCHSVKNVYYNDVPTAQIKKAQDVSFFGPMKYVPSAKKKENIYTLHYDNDQLKYISVGNEKKLKHREIYKVISISDTLTILCSEYHGGIMMRYLPVDTFLIYPDRYIRKTTDRSYQNAAFTNFYLSEFRDSAVIHSDWMFNGSDKSDSVGISMSIQNFAKAATAENSVLEAPHKQSQHYDTSGIENMKLTYFRKRYPY